MAKFNRIRKNIKDYVDMDYLDKLSEEDKDFMNQFTDEYYCGGHGKPNSLHREAFGEDYDTVLTEGKNIRQQLNGDMNAQNRDVTGIANCSYNIIDIDPFIDELYHPKDESMERLLVTIEPSQLLDNLITDLVDELIATPYSERNDMIKSFSYKVITLYALTKKEQQRQKRITK